MKLSPLDIQHMEFSGAVNGYQRRHVREFLERVADEFEELLRENQNLRDELKKRDETIAELQVAEVELKRAVIAAERIANEIRENAKQEAALIVREAEQRRDAIVREAENRVQSAQAEFANLQREQRLFREQFRAMLHAFARNLDSVPGAAPAGRAGGSED